MLLLLMLFLLLYCYYYILISLSKYRKTTICYHDFRLTNTYNTIPFNNRCCDPCSLMLLFFDRKYAYVFIISRVTASSDICQHFVLCFFLNLSSILLQVAYPCGALNVRRLRWQQNPQSFGYPYPRLQLQRHQQQPLPNQPTSSGRLSLSSRHSLRDFCKTQAIC